MLAVNNTLIENNDDFNYPSVYFEDLSKINPEIKAWIYIEDTKINYPITYKDNSYYLTHTFEGTENSSGCIFIDERCSDDFSSLNTIIYGHNMKNLSMFGSLRYYKEKSYWKEHPIIWVVTPYEILQYKIFSVYRTETGSFTYDLDFTNSKLTDDYISKCINSSFYDTGVDVYDTDSIITLSTCTSDTETGRLVVQAKLVSRDNISY